MSEDFTPSLQQLMQRVGFSSFRALSQAAQVSEKQVVQLRRGKIAQMRLETLLRLSQALQVSITELLTTFTKLEVESSELKTQNSKLKTQNSKLHQDLADLKQEYQRLQESLMQQKQEIQQEFQQSSLQILESLLLQLPTAAYAAQQNTQAAAVKLLPLLKPFDRLLQEWGVEQIAPVGVEVPYDPQLHQLMEGSADEGDRVRIRYTDYRQGDRLLYRAKVSPIAH